MSELTGPRRPRQQEGREMKELKHQRAAFTPPLRAGFTLIELLVVVIIVAVLAAVGVPLLSANVTRARGTEAETGLGTLRTALRAYGVENSAYTTTVANLNLTADDLRGQFYNLGAYTIKSADFAAKTFCIEADGSDSTAPGAAKVASIDRSMDQDGTITEALCP
ncbi:MAG: hypothetical protein A3G88_06020 [Omnitrophica WOR_2 bacterium RIFCSPLOWO2_12_FULL_63_16]|nr:MAG: hypothetical protein A3G88_06020 [Omnitrophica WOR_2 bacterium RIFCSPLOWO2_12_FULL_63_16]